MSVSTWELGPHTCSLTSPANGYGFKQQVKEALHATSIALEPMQVPVHVELYYTPAWRKTFSAISAARLTWAVGTVGVYAAENYWMLTGCHGEEALTCSHRLHTRCEECDWYFGASPHPQEVRAQPRDLRDSRYFYPSGYGEAVEWLDKHLSRTANPLEVALVLPEVSATIHHLCRQLSEDIFA